MRGPRREARSLHADEDGASAREADEAPLPARSVRRREGARLDRAEPTDHPLAANEQRRPPRVGKAGEPSAKLERDGAGPTQMHDGNAVGRGPRALIGMFEGEPHAVVGEAKLEAEKAVLPHERQAGVERHQDDLVPRPRAEHALPVTGDAYDRAPEPTKNLVRVGLARTPVKDASRRRARHDS